MKIFGWHIMKCEYCHYSERNNGPKCLDCYLLDKRFREGKIRNMPTRFAIILYKKLKESGEYDNKELSIEDLEKKVYYENYSGEQNYISIDLSVRPAQVNIEMDGKHHGMSLKQAKADLKRTYTCFERGWFTLRIPNILMQQTESEMEDTMDDIINLLIESEEQLEKEDTPPRF